MGESRTFVVALHGVTFGNSDGSRRQQFVSECKVGDILTLRAEPTNPHDRFAVAVYNASGKQLGYLPSDARDSQSLLQGTPMHATVLRRIGGPNLLSRLFRRKRSYGVLIQLEKGPEDWGRFARFRDVASSVDKLVTDAVSVEKSGNLDAAIAAYSEALTAIVNFNRDHQHEAAFRWKVAPINRLTILLVKKKRGDEARAAFNLWQSVVDPIGITQSDRKALDARISKLLIE